MFLPKTSNFDQNNVAELIKNKVAPFETDIILCRDLNIYRDP